MPALRAFIKDSESTKVVVVVIATVVTGGGRVVGAIVDNEDTFSILDGVDFSSVICMWMEIRQSYLPM